MYTRSAHVLFTLFVLVLFASTASAANVSVDSDHPKKNTIQAALDSLKKQGPHTVTVSGTCVEYVVISGFDDLNLIANPGASINDPHPGAPEGSMVSIFTSHVVVVDGFTVNGGFSGIQCGVFASCRLLNNTVQGASGWAVSIGRSSSAELQNTTIRDSVGGLRVSWGGASAMWFGGSIQGITGTNSDYCARWYSRCTSAVLVWDGSYLRLQHNPPNPTLIQQNAGDGVVVSGNSTLELRPGVEISDNGGSGIVLENGSVMETWGVNAITNNGGNAVRVGQSSFAHISDNTTISGNATPQVVCEGTFSNVKGGSNDCSNPP